MWYSVIRWGRVPLNALTFFKARACQRGLNRNLLPAHYETTQGLVRPIEHFQAREQAQV
jgi:hypothetical protein